MTLNALVSLGNVRLKYLMFNVKRECRLNYHNLRFVCILIFSFTI